MKISASSRDQFESVRTPSLLLDADQLESNISAMVACAEDVGLPLRVHLKTSKSVPVIDLLRARAVSRFAVSTVAEARAAHSAGAVDILYTTPLTPEKAVALAELNAGGARIAGVIEDRDMTLAVAAALASHDLSVPVFIEVDLDGVRGGIPVPSADFDTLVETAVANPSLRVAGAMSYSGRTYDAAGPDERERIAAFHDQGLLAVGRRLAELGVSDPVLSTGGSPGVLSTRIAKGATELRPGVFTFWDMAQVLRGVCTVDQLAIGVLATVLSVRPEKGTALIDAGSVALSLDKAGGDEGWRHGRLLASNGVLFPSLRAAKLSQEHGVIDSRTGDRSEIMALKPGQKVIVLPAHACLTASQYTEYRVLRHGVLSGEVWQRFNGW